MELKTPLKVVSDSTAFIAVVDDSNFGFATTKDSQPFVAELVRRANAFDALTKERDALRDALQDLIMSADCSRESRREGHDWAEACAKARKVLLSKGGA